MLDEKGTKTEGDISLSTHLYLLNVETSEFITFEKQIKELIPCSLSLLHLLPLVTKDLRPEMGMSRVTILILEIHRHSMDDLCSTMEP